MVGQSDEKTYTVEEQGQIDSMSDILQNVEVSDIIELKDGVVGYVIRTPMNSDIGFACTEISFCYFKSTSNHGRGMMMTMGHKPFLLNVKKIVKLEDAEYKTLLERLATQDIQ